MMVVTEPTGTRQLPADEGDKSPAMDLQYGIDDNPPWYLCIVLGFQVCFLSRKSMQNNNTKNLEMFFFRFYI